MMQPAARYPSTLPSPRRLAIGTRVLSYRASTSFTRAFRSSRTGAGAGRRAESRKASTIAFRADTWLTMGPVARLRVSASSRDRRSPSFISSRSADSWMGVSGFLISCARRRATSAHAVARCAWMSWVMSSNTTT